MMTFKRLLAPTPALGFILGGFVTTVLLALFRGLLQVSPLFWAVAVGSTIAALAIIWQRIYDRYWEGQ